MVPGACLKWMGFQLVVLLIQLCCDYDHLMVTWVPKQYNLSTYHFIKNPDFEISEMFRIF